MDTSLLCCDGCGQNASPEHIAARLRRLEWMTRYRPVHIGTVLLAGVSPVRDSEFLYSPEGDFSGEAEIMLGVAGILPSGKSAESVQTEFQRAGFLLTHVLECPVSANGENGNSGSVDSLLLQRIPSVVARIRRSLKPKRVALVSSTLQDWAGRVSASELGCELVLDGAVPFPLDQPDKTHAETVAQRLREVLATSVRPG